MTGNPTTLKNKHPALRNFWHPVALELDVPSDGPIGIALLGERWVLVRLHGEIVRALKAPEVIEKMKAQGVTPVGNTPEEFVAVVRNEVDRWARVAKQVKLEVTPLAGGR